MPLPIIDLQPFIGCTIVKKKKNRYSYMEYETEAILNIIPWHIRYAVFFGSSTMRFRRHSTCVFFLLNLSWHLCEKTFFLLAVIIPLFIYSNVVSVCTTQEKIIKGLDIRIKQHVSTKIPNFNYLRPYVVTHTGLLSLNTS